MSSGSIFAVIISYGM